MGFLKKITRPISKALDKIVPNEIKPFLPYVAAVAPMIYSGGLGGTNVFQQMLRRAALSGGLNLGAQLAQEGSEGDFSVGSLGLASLTGALTTPGSSELLGARAGIAAEQPGTLAKIKSSGLQALSKGAGFLEGGAETLRTDPFSMAGLKAATVPIAQGTTDVAMATARKALKDYEDELAAFNEQADATTAASDLARRNAIISSMTAAAFDEDTIDDTLAQLGLRNGGRVGAMNGGIMTAKRGLVNAPGGYAGEEEMDRGGGISIGIGKLYPKMLKQRAGEVVDFLSPSNIKDMPKDFSNFLKKSFNDPEGPYQKIKQDMIKSKDKKSSSDEGFGGIEKAVESVEEKPKTFLVDKLKVTVNPGESQEKAMLNAMFNDVDDVMPQDRKEEFYRLLIPKLKNTGEISDNEYKMLMQEVFSKAKGGIIGLKEGGLMKAKRGFVDGPGGYAGELAGPLNNKIKGFSQQMLDEYLQGNMPEFKGESVSEYYNRPDFTDADAIINIIEMGGDYNDVRETLKIDISDERLNDILGYNDKFYMKDGGITGLKDGGMLNFGGREMDLRTGGFVPIGKKERADDVPARLSKNEFVMTADAVRAAGGGSINKGAQRMYQLMNNLEARA